MNRLNDGSRPSRVRLARVLTGEERLKPGESEAALEAFAAEVAAAPPPAFDLADLRVRATALSEAEMQAALARPTPRPEGVIVPLFRRVAPGLVSALAIAAAALFFLRPPASEGVRIKGEAHLGFDVSRGSQAFPGAPDTVVQAGDRIRFHYGSGGAETLVIVGVDATGTVQTYWPDEGDAPVGIEPGDHVLAGSVQLDDAPGPEVFVAVFDGTPADVVADVVAAAWSEGGVEAVVELDELRHDVAVLVLEKR